MRGVAALLVLACACGHPDAPERTASRRTDEPSRATGTRPDAPDRPDYAPRTAETSIAVDEVFVSDLENPLFSKHNRYITVLGDGTVRYANTATGPETHVGHASRDDVAHVLNELASLDFLNLRCDDWRRVDHGLHISVSLTVRGVQHRVLQDFGGHCDATLGPLVKELETLAERVAGGDAKVAPTR